MFFQSLPIFHNYFSNSLCFSSEANEAIRSTVVRKFAWYCNIKNSLEENSVFRNSFNQLAACKHAKKSINYQNIQSLPEYNRILYSRVSEILRNFKSLENSDDQIMNLKKLNIPKRKNEMISSNSSFFTKNAVFFENFEIPSQPSIPAFSIFSSLFNDFSIKPTGEMPTLRSLWALHQTNFYHFQEKNRIRHLWTLKKRTENLKSLKGTKKAVQFFRKYSGLEKLNSPQFFYSSVNTVKKDKFFQASKAGQVAIKDRDQEDFSRQDEKIYPLLKKSNFLIFENLTNKKKFLLKTNLKTHFYDFVRQLDKMSFQKFLNSQKKCSLFGIHTIQQNSKMSLRFLKFHKSVLLNRQKIAQLESNEHAQQSCASLLAQKDFNQQNSSKSLLNFWWSQKNYTIFDLFVNSQRNRLNTLQFIPFFSLDNAICAKHPESFACVALENKKKNLSFLFLQMEENNNNSFYKLLWFGAIIFHLAIFFTILKLPEIRSVLKFQCILFSKFFAGFFFIIFSLYNSFKKYTKKSSIIANKILSKSSSFVSFANVSKKNKSLSFDLEHSSAFVQNFIFSRNKNLINLLFYFEDTQKSKSFISKKSLLHACMHKNLYFELFFLLSKFSLFLRIFSNEYKFFKL
jgi:hypothetical protein